MFKDYWEQVNHMQEIIYDRLRETARNGRTCFYGDLAEEIDMRPNDPRFLHILNMINQIECDAQRPLLSAVVVRRGYRIPGPGFFTQAEQLARFDPYVGDLASHAAFWVDEIRRVWAHWRP